MKKKRRRRRSTGTVCISIIVVVFVAVMAIQIYQLRQKDADYMARENEQYEQETQRSSEIDDLEKYMQSSEYYEDVAKSKLGLTYKNEIIFKESEK